MPEYFRLYIDTEANQEGTAVSAEALFRKAVGTVILKYVWNGTIYSTHFDATGFTKAMNTLLIPENKK